MQQRICNFMVVLVLVSTRISVADDPAQNPFVDINIPSRLLAAVDKALQRNRSIAALEPVAAKGDNQAQRNLKRERERRKEIVRKVEDEIKLALKRYEPETAKCNQELDRLRRSFEAADDNKKRIAAVAEDIAEVERKIDELAEIADAYRAFAAVAKGERPRRSPYALVDAPAPILKGSNAGNRAAIDLQTFRGRPVLVVFFAAGHEDSLEELEAIRKLWRKHANMVAMIGVSVDHDTEKFEQFIKRKKPSFPVVHDRDGSIRGKWQVAFLPQVALVTPKQSVRLVTVGLSSTTSREYLQQEVQSVLNVGAD